MKDLIILLATAGISAVVFVIGSSIVLNIIGKRIAFKLEIISIQKSLIEFDEHNLCDAWFEILKLFKQEINLYEMLNKKGITIIDDPTSTNCVIVIDTKKFDPNKMKTWRYLYRYQIEKDIKYNEHDKVVSVIEMFTDTIVIHFDKNIEKYIINEGEN